MIYLVRHGQASFGSDNYDLLSPRGHEQAARLRSSWSDAQVALTHCVSGAMTRQRETAVGAVPERESVAIRRTDQRWNEFEHVAMAAEVAADGTHEPRAFQAALHEALARWMAGASGSHESYQEFADRVLAGFAAVVQEAGRGQKVAVFSSAGPIALVVSHLLTSDDALFRPLNDVVVNASVTSVLVGAGGPRLLTFNDHAHVLPDLSTYR